MRDLRLHTGTSRRRSGAGLRVIKLVDGWQPHFAACGVTKADLESLAERIDGAPLRDQRETFNPADYAAPARALRRRSPFAR